MLEEREKFEEPKPAQYPLDRFLRDKKTLVTDDLPPPSSKLDVQTENLRKKINELTFEADRIFKSCTPHQDLVSQSTMTSSTSLNESESSYTEHIVEKKFKEVTFRKQKTMKSDVSSRPDNSRNAINRPIIYCPKNYEELVTRQTQTPARTVKKMYCHIPPASVEKENVFSSHRPTSARSEKSFLTTASSPSLEESSHSEVRAPAQSLSNHRAPDSPPSKLAPSKANYSPCSCSKGRSSHSQKSLGSRISQIAVSSSKVSQRKEGPQGKTVTKNQSKSVIQSVNQLVLASDKHSTEKQYSDACVNTNLVKKPNASLLKVISSKDESTSVDGMKLYQIQELPKVNIRPNLTKQLGPIIDIKESKPFITKTNVAVVKCVHPNDTKDLLSKKNEIYQSNEHLETAFSSQTSEKYETRLQKCINEMLKKINLKSGYKFVSLKKSLTNIQFLLNQITPIQTAPFRSIDEHIMEESSNLLIKNIDVVTELLENELKKSSEKFCLYSDCIIKTVNTLCENIRSIFVVREKEQTFVKSSINTSFFETKRQDNGTNTAALLGSKNKQPNPKYLSDDVTQDKSSTSDTRGKVNDVESSLYIPLRKLVPGGKYKSMEEANSMKEIELRRKRLETINKINQQLKDELPLKRSSSDEDKSLQHFDDNDLLNKTFIIESRSEENVEQLSDKAEEEVLKKSESEYEDDWEQDPGTSNSISGPESGAGIVKLQVEAQVHRSEEELKNEALQEESFQTKCASLKNTQDGPFNSSSEEIKEFNSFRQNKEKCYKQKKIIERLQHFSTGVQTENISQDPLTENSPSSADENISKANNGKHTVKRNVQIANTQAEVLSFPVIRMTNPITKSLLEVRLPEQSDRIQSSILVEKSENKEEIKLLYNMNNEEKLQTWPRCSKHNDSGNISVNKEQAASINHVFSESNVTSKPVTEQVKNATPGSNNNDFQHITTNFIDFLENKVTEMVKKFKLSEISSEKLFTARAELKEPRSSFHITAFDRLNPNMKGNKTIYKSVNSLVSEKSTEELKFHKNFISRGCSPENDRMKYENLISPPLVLKFKHDAVAQTDSVLLPQTVSDACVETTNIGFYTDNSCNTTTKDNLMIEKIKKNDVVYNTSNQGTTNLNSIGSIKNLHLSDIALDVANESLSQNRLLPLPEDVIKTDSTDKDDLNEKDYKCQVKPLVCINDDMCDSLKEMLIQTNDGSVITENVFTNPNTSTQPDSTQQNLGEIVKPKENSVTNNNLGILKTSHPTDEETLIIESKTAELSKIEDDGDSQGTLKLLNIFSITDSGNDLSTKVQKLHSPVATNDVNQSNLQKATIANPNQLILKDTNSAQLMNRYLNTTFKPLSSSNCTLLHKSYVDLDSSKGEFKENQLFVSGPAEQGNVLSSFQDRGTQPAERIVELADTFAKLDQSKNNSLVLQSCSQKISMDEAELVSSRNYRSDTINVSVGIPSDLAESGASSPISDECIPIHYFNSDEMSDGEVRFVYTSNSYSSGEIKPITDEMNENYDSSSEIRNENGTSCSKTVKKEVLRSFSQSDGQAPTEKSSTAINYEGLCNKNSSNKETDCKGVPTEKIQETCSCSHSSISTEEIKQLLNTDLNSVD